jgi:hypothetical protein
MKKMTQPPTRPTPTANRVRKTYSSPTSARRVGRKRVRPETIKLLMEVGITVGWSQAITVVSRIKPSVYWQNVYTLSLFRQEKADLHDHQ